MSAATRSTISHCKQSLAFPSHCEHCVEIISVRYYSLTCRVTTNLARDRQLFFLFQCSKHNPTWTPLSNVLPSANPQPRVPLSRVWALLNILYHVHSAILLQPSCMPAGFLGAYITRLEPPPIWPVTIIPPILCVVLRRDAPQQIWWSIPGCLTAAVTLAKRSIQQSKQDILQLNELKYGLQGA